MTTIERDDPMELIGRAIAAFDAQIAELQTKRSRLAALMGTAIAAAAPKQRGMSDEARAKISAAAKKRWVKKKRAEVAAQAEKPKAKKKAPALKPANAKAIPAKAKQAPATKTKPAKAKPAAAKPKKVAVKKVAAATTTASVQAEAGQNA